MSFALRRSPRNAKPGSSSSLETSRITETKTKATFQGFEKPHPLLIPHIAREIFGYLSFSKLKVCRLVCQAWNEAAANHFQKVSVIVFNSEQRLTEFLKFYTQDNPPRFINYKLTADIKPLSIKLYEFLSRFGSTHVRFIHFDRFNFVVNNKSQHYSVFDRMNKIEEMVLDCRGQPLGPVDDHVFSNLPSLKVFRCAGNFGTDLHMEYFAETLIKIFMVSPKLERISTILKSDKRKLYNYPYQNFIPNLQNIQIPSLTRTENSIMADLSVGTVISSLSFSSKLKNFSHFEMTFPARLSFLNSMNTRKFHLKTVHLCIFNIESENITEALQKFFIQNCQTLITLKVTFGIDESTIIGVHNWSALRNLAIHGCKSANHLNFLNGCDSLETLHLVQCVLPKNFQEFVIHPSLNNLKNFVEHDVKIQGRISGLVLANKMCKEFPYLRKLKMDNLKDSSFRLICKTLVLLEEFAILHTSITDSGLTGISKATLKKSASMTNQRIFKKRLPYIGNLKKLRKLEIGSVNITDISILYGIIDCSTVRRLTIFSPKISGKGLRNIVDKMDLIALTTICCYKIPDSALEYARKKLNDPENVILNAEKGPKSSIEIARIIRSYGLTHLHIL